MIFSDAHPEYLDNDDDSASVSDGSKEAVASPSSSVMDSPLSLVIEKAVFFMIILSAVGWFIRRRVKGHDFAKIDEKSMA
jgi:hypothetical protein